MRLWSEIDKVAFRDHIPISGACSILSSLLRTAARYVIVKTQKGNNRPQGVDLIGKVIMESPPQLAKVPGWFFYALKHYLINVKTNVSNARMNIPKIYDKTYTVDASHIFECFNFIANYIQMQRSRLYRELESNDNFLNIN